LDSYTVSPGQQERGDRAQVLLERACLDRFGLSWSGPGEDELATGKAMVAARIASRFGLVDLAQATRYGYHQPPWSITGLAGRHADADGIKPGSDLVGVLYGGAATMGGRAVPTGGCRGEAARQLASGTTPATDVTLVTRLLAEANRRTLADPRITELFQRWSACLADAGYQQPTPVAVAQDPRWRQDTPPDAAEIAMATADVECKERTAYLSTMVTVTAEHQRVLIAEHAPDLDALRESLAVRNGNVDRVLAPTEGR